MIKLFPLDYGKHENLHMKFVIGQKRHPVVRLHLVVFFETGLAYIVDSMYKLPLEFIDLAQLKETLTKKLQAYDYELQLISDDDWINKDLKTCDILEKIKE